MFRSDLFRASGALMLTCAAATAAVKASPGPAAGHDEPPALPDLVYTLINVTDDYEARRLCPLDENAARARIEAGLSGHANAVYSPIADGPDILVHEMTATASGPETGPLCDWSVAVHLGGHSNRHTDRPGAALSSLEQAGRHLEPLLEARNGTRGTANTGRSAR